MAELAAELAQRATLYAEGATAAPADGSVMAECVVEVRRLIARAFIMGYAAARDDLTRPTTSRVRPRGRKR